MKVLILLARVNIGFVFTFIIEERISVLFTDGYAKSHKFILTNGFERKIEN